MIKTTVINYLGESLVLSPSFVTPISNIDGIGPMDAEIFTSKFARKGTRFNKSTLNERNIVISMKITQDVEAQRGVLSRFFVPGEQVTLIFETNARKGEIVGYTERLPIGWFSKLTSATISVICPDPFFYGDEQTVEFAEEGHIASESVMENDFVATVVFAAEAEDYKITVNGSVFGVNYAFDAGDTLMIDTENRKIMLNGKTNLYNYKSGSWPVLQYGNNVISASADTSIRYTDKYISM